MSETLAGHRVGECLTLQDTRQETRKMSQLTEETPSTECNSYIVGGYRVKFTNWQDGRNEEFFASREDAENYLLSRKAYGYKGTVETIHFRVKDEN